MHQLYQDAVQFYVVYIQEAHPSDGWQMEVNERERVIYAQPTTADERNEVAGACSLGLDLKIPTLLDEMNNEVDEAYAALPDRLYLIDEAGRIAYRSERGPRGFRPEELEAAIESHMAIAASGRRFSA